MKLLPVAPFQETLHAGYCGPAVVKMVLQYYDIEESEVELAEQLGATSNLGTDDQTLKKIFEQFGLKADMHNNSSFEDIDRWLAQGVPVIVDWFTRGHADYPDTAVADGHYSVVVGLDATTIYLQDPEIGGLRKLARADFVKVWFDFRGEYITSWDDMIIRQLIAVRQ